MAFTQPGHCVCVLALDRCPIPGGRMGMLKPGAGGTLGNRVVLVGHGRVGVDIGVNPVDVAGTDTGTCSESPIDRSPVAFDRGAVVVAACSCTREGSGAWGFD
jgi:hypothetical protein